MNGCEDKDFLLYELQPAIIPIQRGEKEVGEIDEYEMGSYNEDEEMEI